MGVHLYTNGAWTDSGKIYRNSLQMLNWNTTEIGSINENTGQPVDWEYSRRSDFIPVANNEYITISGLNGAIRIFIYNTDKIYQSDNFLYENPFTIQNGGYFRFSGPLASTAELSTMINSGTTALPYEAYNIVDWYTNTGHGYSSGAWS